jgi:hypothetical protein
MQRFFYALSACVILAGCTSATHVDRPMTIHWQRLVDDEGRTCDRCGLTEESVRSACATLRQSMAPLGIDVRLTTSTLDVQTFLRSPNESNRIWIAGESLESLLGAEAGQSPCCNACGDNDCRTLVIGQRTYEAVPSNLIVQAGLVAASRIMSRGPVNMEHMEITYCVE